MRFDSSPGIVISQTPYRVCLAGATDLVPYVERFGGEAFSSAIDKYVTIVVRKRNDKKISFYYALGAEDASCVSELKHPYVKACLTALDITGGMDIASFTDVPFSSGLGSSGSFVVGLLNALWAVKEIRKSPRDLAEEAARIEIDVLGAPIGKHDQYLAAFGGICRLYFMKNGYAGVMKIPFTKEERKDFENRLLLVFSGTTRSAAHVLSPLGLKLQSGDPEATSLMHEFRRIGNYMADTFSKRDFIGFGVSINDLWSVEKTLFKNSTERIDFLIELGKNNGALGGMVVGAGGGGFLYFLCPPEKKDDVSRVMAGAGATVYQCAIEKEGSKIVFSQ